MLRVASVEVPQLTRWGASADADLVYRTLLLFGPATPVGLARDLGMQRRRVWQAIDELSACSAVSTAGGGRRSNGTLLWSAEAPQQVMAALRRRQIDQARAAHLMQRQLASLTQLGIPPARASLVRPLDGMTRTLSRVTEILDQEQHELLSMQPDPEFEAEAVQAVDAGTMRMCRRGVVIQALGVPAGVGDTSAEHGRRAIALGMQYREVPSLPGKIAIYGRHTAILPQVPGERRGSLEVTDPDTVHALVEFFLKVWDRAGATREKSDPLMDLTARERAIVRLLAAGHTDTSASAELGLSVRTIAYTLRDLMDRCQVSNRFQLGLVLGAAYLVDPVAAESIDEAPSGPTDPRPDQDQE